MDSDLQTEIVACEQRLYAAMRTSDVAILQELIDDEILFVGPGGEIVTKQMDLELHRSKNIVITELEPKEQEIRCLDNVAVVVTKIFVAGTFLGAPFASDMRYTRVWHRTDTGWRILAGHCGMIA